LFFRVGKRKGRDMLGRQAVQIQILKKQGL